MGSRANGNVINTERDRENKDRKETLPEVGKASTDKHNAKEIEGNRATWGSK